MDKPNAIILRDTVNAVLPEHRATTFLLPRFPYRLIQEIGTHRRLDPCALTSVNPFGIELSRNSASSRAIPLKKVIESIRQDPYIPYWTRANKGMQGVDDLTEAEIAERTYIWMGAMEAAFNNALALDALGTSKQDCNSALLPYMRIQIMVTGTEWMPFFKLRTPGDVHPDFREVALEMQALYNGSDPDSLLPGEWHIPWLQESDYLRPVGSRLKISVARSAWLSYAAHDQDATDEKAFSRHDGLLTDQHHSCFEHQLMAMEDKDDHTRFHGFYPATGKLVHTRNLNGYISYRAIIEDGLEIPNG